MRALALTAVLPILASCASAPPPPPEPIGTAAGPPLVAAPAETATASASVAAAPPPAPSPYFPVIVHGSQLRLSLIKTGAVVIDGYASTPIVVEDRGARFAPELTTGLKGADNVVPGYVITGVSGDWPRSGALDLNIPGDRGGTDVAYTWSGSTWVKAPVQPLQDMPEKVMVAYYQGGLFAATSWGGRELYVMIDAKSPVPAFVLGKRAKGPAPVIAKGSGACKTRLVGYALLRELPGGDLLGAGKLCTSADDYGWPTWGGPGALAVERWRKGSTTSVVETLPGTQSTGMLAVGGGHLLVASPSDLYVYMTFVGDGGVNHPYIAHHDGKAWTDVSVPGTQAISELWVDKEGVLWAQLDSEIQRRKGGTWEKVVPQGAHGDIAWTARAPDGTLWARFDKELWHLGAGGAWDKAVLPADEAGHPRVAERVAWLSSGNMVIVAAGGGDSVLLASAKPDQVLDASAEPAAAAKQAAKTVTFGKVGPPTAACKSLFAVLYKLSRVAPPDFDFPLTREAIKGHTELSDVRFAETEDGGSRYLVAFVPSASRGQKLIALVRDKVNGARPQLLCGEPKVNRTLAIDLRTGALKK